MRARQLLAEMTPEERVGQLVLVTFNGSRTDANTQIFDLITNQHVGGVVLLAGNDNFLPAPDTAGSARALIEALQTLEWQSSQPGNASGEAGTPTPTVPAAQAVPAYIPLFIGITQVGDGYPGDQLHSGVTRLPNLMALGATWNPELARQVGEIAGQELSALGFNLFFGPTLDVSESPESTIANGLKAGVFSGDPYWVGEMGSAYISGLHTGSSGNLLVIADHFPGRGSSDRPSGEEPATVRKSLEQLKQIELAPFFEVTGSAATPEASADGLLVSHIRYQGFQGNIRSTTRPVSFDPQALTQILSLPALASWREAGGILVSDDLGSQTVRSFYDPSGQSFSARLVARDALLAGNDLLYLGNIISGDSADTYTTVIRILEFFAQKYREDQAFAQRVDEAAVRVLTLKFRVYGQFDLQAVLASQAVSADSEQKQAILFEIASRSATLVSPSLQDLESNLPNPPDIRDHIVFLTDTRSGRQCSTCPEQPMLAVDALQAAIFRLYGQQAGGLVMNGRLISYSLDSLAAILPGGSENNELEAYLRQADWVVLNLLDAQPGEAQSIILHRFLAERQDLLRDKQVIVFAFNAPYYLDATEISKLTAYYCLYSKTGPFIDVAARLLFRELTPVGVLPVSVPGIGYDLLSATAPDPEQIIDLSLDTGPLATPAASETQQLPATPNFRVGDTVAVRTGIIQDHNGHPVPDGTGVLFTITMSGDTSVIRQLNAVTLDGVAGVSFTIDRVGILEIRAESEPARTSVVLQLNATGEGLSVTVVAPTPVGGATVTPGPARTPEQEPEELFQDGRPGFIGWLFFIGILLALSSLVFWVAGRGLDSLWAVRITLCALAGGIITYLAFALQLPGAVDLLRSAGWPVFLAGILAGVLGGSVVGLVWHRLSTRRH